MESGKSSKIRSIDLDGSDNLSEGVIKKFIDQHHVKLEGLVLTGMGQISDMLFITELPKTKVNKMKLLHSNFHSLFFSTFLFFSSSLIILFPIHLYLIFSPSPPLSLLFSSFNHHMPPFYPPPSLSSLHPSSSSPFHLFLLLFLPLSLISYSPLPPLLPSLWPPFSLLFALFLLLFLLPSLPLHFAALIFSSSFSFLLLRPYCINFHNY